MKVPITLGVGIAADVSIVDGLVYVAYGTVPHALVLAQYTLAGVKIGQEDLPFGFDQSFPRFSGPWLVYRQNEAHGFEAVAFNVVTRQFWAFQPAGGTYGLTVNADLGLMAYEWRRSNEPWHVWFGSLLNGETRETPFGGAPDGLDQILSPSLVTLRKDTRGDVSGIWYPVRAGALTVGELRDEPGRPNGGIGVQLPGQILRVALEAQNDPDPRCATDGTTYAIVCWNPVRLLLYTMAELRALPPVVSTQPPPPPPPPPPLPEEPPAVSFEHRMPNRRDVVERTKLENPREWAAREDLRFIKRVAWALHLSDSRFGLLGKRMTDTIAADSIAYLNPTVDPQLPAEMSCEAADVITGSHSDNPQPGWSEITVPVREGGAGAKWIEPQPVSTPVPIPDPPPPTDDLARLKAQVSQLQAELVEAKDAAREAAQEREAIAIQLAACKAASTSDVSAILPELKAIRTTVNAISDKVMQPTPTVPPSVTFPNYKGKLPVFGTVTWEPVK